MDDRLSTLPTMEQERDLGSGNNHAAQAMSDNCRRNLDSTTVRGHVSAAGAKDGLANKLLAARGAGSPVRSVVSVKPTASRSSSIARQSKPQTKRRSKM